MAGPKADHHNPWELAPGHQVHGRGLSLPERLRAARRIPQAIVKVASFCNGIERTGHLMSYISREGELELETESGDIIAGLKEQKALIREWARQFDEGEKSRDVAHIVYSMPRGSSAEALRRSVREAIKRSFPDHPAVFAIHEDRGHPHAHVAVRMRSREKGKKLRLKKADLHQMREVFAEAAREHGVELAVSPRPARGVSERRPKLPVVHLRQRKEVSRADRAMVRESMRELASGNVPPRPWEKAMERRHQAEKAAYAAAARQLREAAMEKAGPARLALFDDALLLERFGQTLPAPKTRRQRWVEKLRAQMIARPQPERAAQERALPDRPTMKKDKSPELEI